MGIPLSYAMIIFRGSYRTYRSGRNQSTNNARLDYTAPIYPRSLAMPVTSHLRRF